MGVRFDRPFDPGSGRGGDAVRASAQRRRCTADRPEQLILVAGSRWLLLLWSRSSSQASVVIHPKPVTLEGNGVRLEPMKPEHASALEAAAADGELWKLW